MYIDRRKKATYHVSNGIRYSPNLAFSLFIRAWSVDLYLPIIFAFCQNFEGFVSVLCVLLFGWRS